MLDKKKITEIFYSIEGYQNNIKIIFQFGDDCLYFDSRKFIYSKTDLIMKQFPNWRKIDYDSLEKGIAIVLLREDESTSYFIKFSNDDIFFIYQSINNNGFWLNSFEIVRNTNIERYDEIRNYMEEDFVDDIKIDS